MRNGLKRVQITTDVARGQAMTDIGTIVVAHPFASNFENGDIIGNRLDLKITASSKRAPCRLQRQQDQEV